MANFDAIHYYRDYFGHEVKLLPFFVRKSDEIGRNIFEMLISLNFMIEILLRRHEIKGFQGNRSDSLIFAYCEPKTNENCEIFNF